MTDTFTCDLVFANGIKLIKLIEVIWGENLRIYHKIPRNKFEKVENLNIPLNYKASSGHQGAIPRATLGISNQYSAENIPEASSEVLILGMIY